MKPGLLIFLVFAMFSTMTQLTGQSQYASADESDPAALKLLEKISTDYLGKKAHAIDFTLDIELPGSGKESQKGQLVQSGEKFILDLGERQIMSNSETVWLYLKELNEVQINDADFEESEEFLSPSDIFNLYKSKDYVFAVVNYGNENGDAITQIEGKPLSEESDYSKMRLTIKDKGTKVQRLKIFSKDGSRFTLHIDKHDSDYKTDDAAFNFDATQYEGVHVEDLRF